jgi:hypothetical protein
MFKLTTRTRAGGSKQLKVAHKALGPLETPGVRNFTGRRQVRWVLIRKSGATLTRSGTQAVSKFYY